MIVPRNLIKLVHNEIDDSTEDDGPNSTVWKLNIRFPCGRKDSLSPPAGFHNRGNGAFIFACYIWTNRLARKRGTNIFSLQAGIITVNILQN
jgi:hypothetical protein